MSAITVVTSIFFLRVYKLMAMAETADTKFWNQMQPQIIQSEDFVKQRRLGQESGFTESEDNGVNPLALY